MSGSTIGGVVGAGIGWFATGGTPQGAYWGWTLGSMAGAIADPQKIEGPKLGDMTLQSSQDGVPRVYGSGTFPVEQTWLMWRDEVKKFRKKQKAKGGPTQVTNHASLSFAIAVCKGPISGFKIIFEDGKIVFDARTDAELTALGYTSQQITEQRAAQAKFLLNTTFYYGDGTQMPDPTMVAVEGANNVPAYSDTAYFVRKDVDITQRGAIPVYKCVVATCGERTENFDLGGILLVTGTPTAGGQPMWAVADASPTPTWIGLPQSSGANLATTAPAAYYNGTFGVVSTNNARHSSDPKNAWTTGATSANSGAKVMLAAGPAGWLAKRDGALTDGRHLYTAPNLNTPFSEVTYQFNSTLVRYTGGYYYIGWSYFLARSANLVDWELVYEEYDGSKIINFYDIEKHGSALYAIVDSVYLLENRRVQIRRSDDEGATWPNILLDMPPQVDTDRPLQLESNGTLLLAYCENGYIRSLSNGFTSAVPCGLAGVGILNTAIVFAVPGRKIASSADRFFILGDGADSTKSVSTLNGVTFTEPVDIPLADTFTIVASNPDDMGTPIPDAPGYFIDPQTGLMTGPSGTQIDPCTPTLGSIVAKECHMRSVTTIDVSELPDPVTGFRVGTVSTGQRNIQALQPGFLFDLSEFDGTAHFVKRGRAPTFHLTMDDLVWRDSGTPEWETRQETELLRKVTVGYIDPIMNYTATTQPWERTATTIKAEGEGTMELPVTGTGDWARQVAHKNGKIAWGERENTILPVTIEHAQLVTAAVGTFTDDEAVVHTIRIERIEDEGMVRTLHVRRTSAHLYESNVTGVPKPLPRYPGADIRGPSNAAVMNLPVLVDANDTCGVHWAASGLTGGYAGTQLQLLRGSQWTIADELLESAAMGVLLSPLPAPAGEVDYTSVLHIRINDELESVTFVELLNERNPMAILRDDGTAEIVQPQTCVAVAAGEYQCTTLVRYRMDTTGSAHDAGARVVFLDERVGFVTLPPTDIGQTLTFRAVPLGTDPDAAPTFTVTLATMESQREWQPYNATYVADGDDWLVSFIGRQRLGTDSFPVASAHFMGWRIDFTVGAETHSHMVNTQDWRYAEAQQIADFGSAQASFDSVTVTAINQFTNGDGAGNPGTGATATLL